MAELRDYTCSACGSFFTSRASTVRNARHRCGDGRTGTGQLVLAPEPEPEPEPTEEENPEPSYPDVEAVAEATEELEFIPGDIAFEDEEDERGPSGEIPSPELPPEPKPEPTPHKRTRATDASKVQNLIRVMYAAGGAIELTADEEALLLGELWSSFGEVQIDTGEIYIPGYVYLIACGIATAALTARRTIKAIPKPKSAGVSDPFGA